MCKMAVNDQIISYLKGIFNPLRPDLHLQNIDTFSFCYRRNTLYPIYKKQPVNAF